MSIFACRWLIVYHPGWNHINKCISITRPWQQLLNPLSLCMFPGILSELILQSADVHGIILNEDKEVVQWGFLTFFFFLSVLRIVLMLSHWSVGENECRYPKQQNATLQSLRYSLSSFFFFPWRKYSISFD